MDWYLFGKAPRYFCTTVQNYNRRVMDGNKVTTILAENKGEAIEAFYKWMYRDGDTTTISPNLE